MEAYHICGGKPLRGTVRIHGAKNSALPILAATLVTGGRCVISNCPNITDVDVAINILRHLGCEAERKGQCVIVDTAQANRWDIPEHMMCAMRGAVIFLGALLTRFGAAEISLPGGCPLGERPIDFHLAGLRHMDAQIIQNGNRISCTGSRLKGCTIALPFPSVGATENLLLAALNCRGSVTICNAAREPEIDDLIVFLRACGAEISGEGTSILHVKGRKVLHPADHTVMPDRMEAASYLAAAAATRGEITLCNVCPSHLTAVTDVLGRMGCEIRCGEQEIALTCQKLRAAGAIHTAPYDGFPTDAQAPVMAAAAVAEGITVFEETIFTDRFQHVPALCRMGAKIYAAQRYAVINGVRQLYGTQADATDLRGGAAIVIAALCAQGESLIGRIEHIERGYSDFVETLRSCGAQIERRISTDGTQRKTQKAASAYLSCGAGCGTAAH